MFSIDSELRQQVIDIARDQGARIAGIITVLLKKGIVTTKELETAIAQCETAIDQACAATRDEAK